MDGWHEHYGGRGGEGGQLLEPRHPAPAAHRPYQQRLVLLGHRSTMVVTLQTHSGVSIPWGMVRA